MMQKICESIFKTVDTKNVLLAGDFRIIDWKGLCFSRTLDNVFIDTIIDNSLNQIIDIPTRGKNTLDLAFVGDQCRKSVSKKKTAPKDLSETRHRLCG